MVEWKQTINTLFARLLLLLMDVLDTMDFVALWFPPFKKRCSMVYNLY